MIFFYCILGIIAGIIAGLIPGLHTNNISILALASPLFGTEFAAFILSMCAVQTFVDFIPAIFIGAPDSDTFEGVLPGHTMLLEGKGMNAICHTVFGGIVSLVIGALLTPFFFLFIVQNSDNIITVTPIILAFSLLMFVLGEDTKNKKLFCLFAIICAGTQGFLFKNQIYPLITGYFGVPAIAYALEKQHKQINQSEEVEIKNENIFDGLLGMAGGSMVALMPGIGSNVAAGIIRLFTKKIKRENYLTLIGSINAANFFFSYAVLFALSKARNGAMIVLKEKIFFTNETFLLGITIMVFAGGIGGMATIFFAKKAIGFFTEKRTLALSIGALATMILLVGIFNGVPGLIALVFSSALGFLVLFKKIRRSCCMASLIIPAMFFYTFILI
ncbi:MAG: tripartite tricarboxylate transporter permease [Candidatus Diapherotrites archaeon]|nr:tripartite tricarboxylate transporter permease [Candidatus Diapherotrites archaeon]